MKDEITTVNEKELKLVHQLSEAILTAAVVKVTTISIPITIVIGVLAFTVYIVTCEELGQTVDKGTNQEVKNYNLDISV